MNADYGFEIHSADSQDTRAEYLLYDFNCGVGDTFQTVGFDDIALGNGIVQDATVTGISYIPFGDTEYKCLTFRTSSMSASEESYVVEGVGPEWGLLCFPQFGNPTSGMYTRGYELVDMTDLEGKVLYRPYSKNSFFAPGKKWTLEVTRKDEESLQWVHIYHDFCVTGETMIDGQPCAVISYGDSTAEENVAFYGYENNGVVYAAMTWDKIFKPMLDFNVSLNEKLEGYMTGDDFYKRYMTVEDIDTEQVSGIDRKVITIGFFDGAETTQWIDGIGAVNPDLMMLGYSIPTDGSWRRLYECWEGDQCIFNYNEYMGNDELKQLSIGQNKESDSLYELTGRPVAKPQPGSIYIRNGKKIIFSGKE